MAAQVTATAEIPDAFVWKFPGAPIRVYVSYGVVERLSADTSGTAERAGLLFGRQTATAAIILDYHPIQNESLSKWLERAKPRGIKKSCGRERDPMDVIGAYRIDGGDRIVLSPEDRSLMGKHFSGQQDIFMKVRRDPDVGPSTAGFFFWDGGEMFGDFCLLEFPLDVPFLKADAQQRNEPAAGRAAEAARPAAPRNVAPAKTRKHGWAPMAATAALVVCLAGGAWYWRTRPSTPPPAAEPAIVTKVLSSTPSSLGFQAEARQTDLHIKWNRAADIIQSARIGVLSIADGGSKREVPLTADQLRSGSVTYTPVSPSIELRLEVFSEDGRRMSEDALAIWIRTPNRPAPAPVASARAPEPEEEETVASRSITARPFVFSPQVASQSHALPEPPPMINAGAAPRVPPSVRGTVTIPAPLPQAPAPAQTGAQTNAPSSAAVNPPASTPPQRVINALPVTPAKPLRRVPPVLASNVRAMLRGDAEVAVKVLVDAKGNVANAEIVSPMEGFPRVLIPPALSAARQWRFEPARTENGPLPSEFILKFHFSRNP